jgi:hypothetical protein
MSLQQGYEEFKEFEKQLGNIRTKAGAVVDLVHRLEITHLLRYPPFHTIEIDQFILDLDISKFMHNGEHVESFTADDFIALFKRLPDFVEKLMLLARDSLQKEVDDMEEKMGMFIFMNTLKEKGK